MTHRFRGLKSALLFLKDEPDRELFLVDKADAAVNLCNAGFLAAASTRDPMPLGHNPKHNRSQLWPELVPYRIAIWPRNSYGGYFFVERAWNILVTSGHDKKTIRIIKPFGPFGKHVSIWQRQRKRIYNDPVALDETTIQNHLALGEEITIFDVREVTIPARLERRDRMLKKNPNIKVET